MNKEKLNIPKSIYGFGGALISISGILLLCSFLVGTFLNYIVSAQTLINSISAFFLLISGSGK